MENVESNKKHKSEYQSANVKVGEAENTEQAVRDHTKVVADHYNAIEEKGLDGRFQSPIFHMRNFNNWIKGMIISEYLEKINRERGYNQAVVLDMCCGKGGDLLKWKIGKIKQLVCVDIASVSMTNCEDRYKSMERKSDRRNLFTSEFLVADCTNVRLREIYNNPSVEFDLVNCQFAFHYGFETLPQAECMLRNASENLKSGGYFIGTIPDAYDIIRRTQKSDGTSVGNSVFKIELQFNRDEGIPLFGAKYNFHLEGVVDCPEFLVHFPTLIDLAKKYDLHLVFKERFEDYFLKNKDSGKELLKKMLCFENYPPPSEPGQRIDQVDEYEHARKYIEENTNNRGEKFRSVGTMSKSEWEAASIYLVFAFQKGTRTGNKEDRDSNKSD